MIISKNRFAGDGRDCVKREEEWTKYNKKYEISNFGNVRQILGYSDFFGEKVMTVKNVGNIFDMAELFGLNVGDDYNE